MGGCNSANSIAVIPTAHISHLKSYPPFLSTAATSGAILKQISYQMSHLYHSVTTQSGWCTGEGLRSFAGISSVGS